jgi:hypothetical protein
VGEQLAVSRPNQRFSTAKSAKPGKELTTEARRAPRKKFFYQIFRSLRALSLCGELALSSGDFLPQRTQGATSYLSMVDSMSEKGLTAEARSTRRITLCSLSLCGE